MGKFQRGQERPVNSGRQKGIPNRKTLILRDTFKELGQDLPTKIMEILPQLSPEKQIDVYMELMQYVYPKRKAIEISEQNKETGPQVVVYIPENGSEAPESEIC
jgi:hypothetical protein